MIQVQIFERIESLAALDLIYHIRTVNVQLILAQNGNGIYFRKREGIRKTTGHFDPVAVKCQFHILRKQLLFAVKRYLVEVAGIPDDGCLRHGKGIQAIHEAFLVLVPIQHITEGKITGKLQIRQIPGAFTTAGTGDGIAMTFKMGNTAIGAYIQNPL